MEQDNLLIGHSDDMEDDDIGYEGEVDDFEEDDEE